MSMKKCLTALLAVAFLGPASLGLAADLADFSALAA